MSYRSYILGESGLVRYWDLADAAASATVAEATGVGGTSTVVATVTFNQASILAGDTATGALFDGTAGAITQDATRKVDTTTLATFTYEAWVKPTAVPATGVWRAIIGSVDDNSFAFGLNGNQLRLTQTALRDSSLLSTATFTANSVYHVGCRYTKATRALDYIVNGTLAGSATGVFSGDPAVGLGSGSIGTRTQGAQSDWFSGQIQHVAIYNVLLTDAQFAYHYWLGMHGDAKAVSPMDRSHFPKPRLVA